jgi:hypothetical protein
VISDDRELGERCKTFGSEVVGSSEFSERLAMVFLLMDEVEPPDEDEGAGISPPRKRGPANA